jgi:hypothetical protein
MPDLGLKEYLETATTASSRARTVTIILAVASVLIFVGFLNSSDYGWMQLRLNKLKDPTSEYYRRYIPADKQGAGDQSSRESQEFTALYSNLQRAYVDNAYVVKVPFFGVAFDVNDLGPLGGISLITILIILRLSLRTQIVSLRVAFKRALRSDEAATFYDLLAARQVFTFPTLKDEEQEVESAKGNVERKWERLKARIAGGARAEGPPYEKRLNESPEGVIDADAGGSGATQNGTGEVAAGGRGWSANRHGLLSMVSRVICFIPTLAYAPIVVQDYLTRQTGYELSYNRTRVLIAANFFFLLLLVSLGGWCVSKWNEIDRLWKYFEDEVAKGEKWGKAGEA